jgi:hypothetical protein
MGIFGKNIGWTIGNSWSMISLPPEGSDSVKWMKSVPVSSMNPGDIFYTHFSSKDPYKLEHLLDVDIVRDGQSVVMVCGKKGRVSAILTSDWATIYVDIPPITHYKTRCDTCHRTGILRWSDGTSDTCFTCLGVGFVVKAITPIN